jgi:hypothetical protein
MHINSGLTLEYKDSKNVRHDAPLKHKVKCEAKSDCLDAVLDTQGTSHPLQNSLVGL